MGPRGKMVLGAILVIGGLWWYVPNGPFNSVAVPFSTLTNLQSLVIAVQGGLGVLIALIGAFVVWIERDELRIRREMESRDFGEDVQRSVEAVTSPDETEEEEEGHVCDKCGESFDSERGLHIHQGQKH